MRYRSRHIENKLKEYAEHFKAVLVTGARQVGKSTLLQHVFPKYKVIVFDPVQDMYGAREDPDLFLQNFKPPLILDEIQFAPELLPSLKRKMDQTDEKGQYLLTGSQNLSVLRTVSESMAGRVGVMQLEAMTFQEIMGEGKLPSWLDQYLRSPDLFFKEMIGRKTKGEGITETIWRGGMPGILELPNSILPEYFRSYTQTYIERDIRLLENIRDLTQFGRFFSLLGALTAQEINTSQLGREVGVSPNTAKKWLGLLSNTFQWLELSPYHGNTIKRLSGKNKGLMRDTGLTCFLQRISSPDALGASPQLGQLFETIVINTLFRQSMVLSTIPQFYHWRTNGGAKVDLLLERDGRLYPIEVKCKSRLTKNDLRGLRAFRETYPESSVMPGLVIYAGTECYQVDHNVLAVPWNI